MKLEMLGCKGFPVFSFLIGVNLWVKLRTRYRLGRNGLQVFRSSSGAKSAFVLVDGIPFK
jgi:hypothetical protein